MRPDANIINTARGGTIDEKALIDLLKKHKIAGAGIDVFEKSPYEFKIRKVYIPPKDHPWRKFKVRNYPQYAQN